MSDSILNLPPPTVVVGITPETLHLTRTDRHTPCDSVGLHLATLEKEGYMGACQRLGTIAMAFLSDAHPFIFERYPALRPPTAAANPVGLMLALIKLSREHETKQYAPAIDALAERPECKAMKRAWGELRPEIMGFPD